MESGDVLLIRTGHLARYYDGIVTDTSDPKPGPHVSCLPWFRERVGGAYSGMLGLGSSTMNNEVGRRAGMRTSGSRYKSMRSGW